MAKSWLRRRLRLVVIAVLVFALVLGAFIQVSTRRALERAEAFEFRRMLVTRQVEEQTYRFFFVTNRQTESAGDAREIGYGNQRDVGLTFGHFDTAIEPSLGIGMLINPTDWFQNEEIKLHEIRALEEDAFYAEIREQVDASPYSSLLINVNGFREQFPSALRKTAFLAHVLDINSPLLVFDWPGDQGSTIRGYRRAQQLARDSGEELAQTLRLVIDRVQPERLWLLANSMGAEVVVSAMTILYQNADMADEEPEVDHVLLTAPDVSHEEFGSQFRDEINALSRNLSVYVSSNDRALLVSRILNRERRLGESTANPANPDQSEEAAEALELVVPGDERVTLIDTTPVNRTRNFHNFSLETPEFFDDLFLRITKNERPQTRQLYRIQTADGKEYWILTRGR